ncbi:hypothetical protein FG877_10630 [Enterococcus casseliflavus]|nr:hypothetical protein [Enterococcus casseliflavus]
MKKTLSLIIGILIGGILLETTDFVARAADDSSVGISQGSIILKGWADIPAPEPNKPVGPQGNSNLAYISERRMYPQTNEKKKPDVKCFGTDLVDSFRIYSAFAKA